MFLCGLKGVCFAANQLKMQKKYWKLQRNRVSLKGMTQNSKQRKIMNPQAREKDKERRVKAERDAQEMLTPLIIACLQPPHCEM